MVADDLDSLLHPAAPGHDILGHNELFAGLDLKSSAEDQTAVAILFDKDAFLTDVAGHFLTDNDAADSGRNDGRCRKGAKLVCEEAANFGGDSGILNNRAQ